MKILQLLPELKIGGVERGCVDLSDELVKNNHVSGVISAGGHLVSNLGAGPRDGLMIGLQKISNFPIALVRAILEISVVSIGWYLGGTVGVGTLLFAFGIGPCVALGLYLVDKTFD